MTDIDISVLQVEPGSLVVLRGVLLPDVDEGDNLEAVEGVIDAIAKSCGHHDFMVVTLPAGADIDVYAAGWLEALTELAEATAEVD